MSFDGAYFAANVAFQLTQTGRLASSSVLTTGRLGPAQCRNRHPRGLSLIQPPGSTTVHPALNGRGLSFCPDIRHRPPSLPRFTRSLELVGMRAFPSQHSPLAEHASRREVCESGDDHTSCRDFVWQEL